MLSKMLTKEAIQKVIVYMTVFNKTKNKIDASSMSGIGENSALNAINRLKMYLEKNHSELYKEFKKTRKEVGYTALKNNVANSSSLRSFTIKKLCILLEDRNIKTIKHTDLLDIICENFECNNYSSQMIEAMLRNEGIKVII